MLDRILLENLPPKLDYCGPFEGGSLCRKYFLTVTMTMNWEVDFY